MIRGYSRLPRTSRGEPPLAATARLSRGSKGWRPGRGCPRGWGSRLGVGVRRLRRACSFLQHPLNRRCPSRPSLGAAPHAAPPPPPSPSPSAQRRSRRGPGRAGPSGGGGVTPGAGRGGGGRCPSAGWAGGAVRCGMMESRALAARALVRRAR